MVACEFETDATFSVCGVERFDGKFFKRDIAWCTSRDGKTWNESCTLWDDQHRYEITVDTSNYPYPIQVMRGSWSVNPSDNGSIVGMDFRFQPRPGIAGSVSAVLMNAAFPFVLRRILKGWERELYR